MLGRKLKRRPLIDGLYANAVVFLCFGLVGGALWLRILIGSLAWWAFSSYRQHRFIRSVILNDTSGYGPSVLIPLSLECYYLGLTVDETCEVATK